MSCDCGYFKYECDCCSEDKICPICNTHKGGIEDETRTIEREEET